jgi:F-type H+-transporting ATPase subunit alpha
MSFRPEEVSAVLAQELERYEAKLDTKSVGSVLSVGDGIARVWGLEDAKAGELLEFPGGVMGMVLNLEEDNVGAVLFGSDKNIKEGDQVKCTGRIASVPVGKALIGRVVNALGQPVDGKGPIGSDKFRNIEFNAPGVIDRQSVQGAAPDGHQGHRRHDPDRPRPARAHHRRPPDRQDHDRDRHHPQSEGDGRHLHLRRDRSEGVHGRERRGDAREARRHGVHDRRRPPRRRSRRRSSTSRPTAGVAMGEEFMYNGGHVLCVYDDLSKQAAAYRQLALLLRRPPGREAYPGDVFYLHSRLLERAAKLSDKLGGGSLTALPFIETQAGDVSAYIPTNVISITDGQIFLEGDLFYSGVRPAINVGISVSASAAPRRSRRCSQVAGRLRLDLAQYRELAAFAQFGSDLDKATQAQLTRGERMVELLKQGQFQPMPVEKQVVSIFAGTNGYLDDLPVAAVRRFEDELLAFVDKNYAELPHNIRTSKSISDDDSKKLHEAVKAFKAQFKA